LSERDWEHPMPGKGWVKNKMILIMEKFKELSLEEQVEFQGGGFWGAIGVGLAIAGAIIYCVNEYPDMVKGFKDGYAGAAPNPPSTN